MARLRTAPPGRDGTEDDLVPRLLRRIAGKVAAAADVAEADGSHAESRALSEQAARWWDRYLDWTPPGPGRDVEHD